MEKTKFDGRKILIVGDHPHKDDVAHILGAELTVHGKWGFVVKPIDYGEEYFVFKPEHVKFLD